MAATQSIPATLMPEILGFSPQLLLDDIITAANVSIDKCVDGMEPFLYRWADLRVEKSGGSWDGDKEVENGLGTFQMLLESHTDIAFDFFEAWSLRNIFSLPVDLHIVAPHHQGLNLHERPEEETDLMTEIEDLRRKIDNQRRLKRKYSTALRLSRVGLHRSEQRLRQMDFLADTTTTDLLAALPKQVLQLYESVSSLPHIDPTASAGQPLPDPSKRQWETNRTGYSSWAVGQLISRSKEKGPSLGGSTAVGNAAEQAYSVGEAADVKALVELEGHVQLGHVQLEEDIMETDSS